MRTKRTTASFFVFLFIQRCGKCLRVDDHHVDARVAGKIIQWTQIGTVTNKEPCLLAVLLHEVVLSNLKGLFHALTNGNAGNDHKEFAPAVTSVQLKHRFDVNVGLSCAGLHFNVKGASANMLDQSTGKHNVVRALNLLDVAKQLTVGKLQLMVAIASSLVGKFDKVKFMGMLFAICFAHVPQINGVFVVLLTVEDRHGAFHRIRLVALCFEFHA